MSQDDLRPDKKAWYADLTTDEERIYEEAVMRIKEAVEKGMSFEEACHANAHKEARLRVAIEDDALKVLIAEMHFTKRMSTADVAKKLKLQIERIEKARAEMLKDVEQEAIDAYKASIGQVGNA